ncbi:MULTISPECIES: DUF5615 family PIN-like protein [unclassified Microcoleus]|uniref:DUF5615 family PIN-like protein n=1 Tax=unclassified Microcoleus TaxID=2642155 RepID=UPI002FD6E304
MARLYADEQYPYPVVELLRALGHDVLTVQEAGRANQKIPDPDVLAFANRINAAITAEESLQGKLIPVVRPSP